MLLALQLNLLGISSSINFSPTRNASIESLPYHPMSICAVIYGCSLQTGPLEAAIFADYGTDLGSGPTVPGLAIFY